MYLARASTLEKNQLTSLLRYHRNLASLHILNKPENQVAAFEVQLETWQPRYTIGNKELYQSTIEFAFNIVRKELTKDVGRFAGIMAEELAAGIDNCWGSSEEWITVNVYDTSSQIIARTMSRLFFGMPLCKQFYCSKPTQLNLRLTHF